MWSGASASFLYLTALAEAGCPTIKLYPVEFIGFLKPSSLSGDLPNPKICLLDIAPQLTFKPPSDALSRPEKFNISVYLFFVNTNKNCSFKCFTHR